MMNSNPSDAQSTHEKLSKEAQFVTYVIERTQQDSGFGARLRRADNPATEFQSWEYLLSFNVDLEQEWQRLPYCTVGAALARAKLKTDGQLPLGQAIAACFEKGNQSDQAKMRLRRLLACTTTKETCQILRPLLALMDSRGITPNFSQLLEQLIKSKPENRRVQWAKQFYRTDVSNADLTKDNASND